MSSPKYYIWYGAFGYQTASETFISMGKSHIKIILCVSGVRGMIWPFRPTNNNKYQYKRFNSNVPVCVCDSLGSYTQKETIKIINNISVLYVCILYCASQLHFSVRDWLHCACSLLMCHLTSMTNLALSQR